MIARRGKRMAEEKIEFPIIRRVGRDKRIYIGNLFPNAIYVALWKAIDENGKEVYVIEEIARQKSVRIIKKVKEEAEDYQELARELVRPPISVDPDGRAKKDDK